MSAKKSTKKPGKAVTKPSRKGIKAVYADGPDADQSHSNGKNKAPQVEFEDSDRPTSPHLNLDSDEEREKRLAARKALTLKAFRIAYENHHRRKAP